MRVFAAILYLLSLLMASAAGALAAYNWLTFNRQLNELYRADDRAAQRQETEWDRLIQQIQIGDVAQARQLEMEVTEIVQRLQIVEQRREQTSRALLTNGILAAVSAAERAAYLGQPPQTIDTLLATSESLIDQLPQTTEDLVHSALQRDRERLAARPAQNVTMIAGQIEAIQQQLTQMTTICCAQEEAESPPPDDADADEADTGLWQRLLALLGTGFRLERIEVMRTLPPGQYEYALIRAQMGAHLAQARLGLLTHNQAIWDSAWQSLLSDAQQLLTEDTQQLKRLQQQIIRVAAIEIGLQPFEFRESRRALEALRQ